MKKISIKYINKGKAQFLRLDKKQKIIALILVGGVVLMLMFRGVNSDDEPSYQFATIKTGSITQIVSETGEITTSNMTPVVSTSLGIITEVYVENASVVKRGDSLFYVESTATEAERAKTLSDYQGAKATLEQAKASQFNLQAKMFTEWDTFKELAESGDYQDEDGNPIYENRALPEFHIPEKEWLAAEANYKAQEQVVSKARSALNNAWLAYQATTNGPISATAAGEVANLSVAVGQRVDTNDTALIIKSDGQDWVKVGINENDIVSVKSGQSVNLVIDALDGIEVSGIVQRVDEYGTKISDVSVYYVYVSIDSPVEEIRPGMTVQVDITTQKKENILLVPNTAIKPYQGEKAVQLLDEESKSVIYQPISVGIQGDVYSEITRGLKEGQKIIISSTDSSSSSGGGLFQRPD